MSMVRSFLLTTALLLLGTWVIGQTALKGKVTEPAGAAFGCTVKVMKGSDIKAGAQTDFDGNYFITLEPGIYDVEFVLFGWTSEKITGVQVLAGKNITLDKQFKSDDNVGVTIKEAVITAYKVPLIQQDNTTQGGSFTAETIRDLPTKSVNAIVATTAGVSSVDGGDVSVRGSRDNATNYYIDGIRTTKNNLPPTQDIDQLQVATGGLGAEFGDVTGGVISIFTKGPASKFTGGIEMETSGIGPVKLDPFGYNQVNANVSGPLIKRKIDGKRNGGTILGFRLSGTGTFQQDDDRPAIPVYRIKDEKYAELTAHPTTKLGTSIIPSAETLRTSDMDVLDYRKDEERSDVDVTGKLDFRLTDNIDMSLTGTFNDSRNKFTPGLTTFPSWAAVNSRNNPTTYANRYRGIFRFRHRLGNANAEQVKGEKAPLISNAQYSLSFGFEKFTDKTADPVHGDNLFNYGYIGNFGFDWVNKLDDQFASPTFGQHVDWTETFTGYTAGTLNPVLAAYNEFANPEDIDTYIRTNGRSQTGWNGFWNDMHSSVGSVYNRFLKNENDIYTLNATSSFNLSPGGSKKGTHNITLGLIYEQRIDRKYDLAPYGLYNFATLAANAHILGVDTTNKLYKVWSPFLQDSTWIYGKNIAQSTEVKFYKKIREANGTSLQDFVNVNSMDPSQLSLSMFSPKELTDQEVLDYYGYDYLGNKLTTQPSFNDFFTKKDADGFRVFPMGARTPVYQAAYIQDKFTFRDIIFRLGVRVDRYDANTKIMKDPYSLYEINSAKDYFAQQGKPLPGNINADWKVYTEEEDDKLVKGFRSGDQWYTKEGTQASDGNVIFGGGVVNPSLRFPDADIKDEGFDPNQSFEDYKPQVNVMPRLAFSFPISADANFFAHYDILTQRPPSDNFMSPLDYYYFYDKLVSPNQSNAALKPEKTIDYEVGFQQKLNNYSALKVSAYYKELRDMIQRRTYLFIPVKGQYETFGNIDFGTVKGFSTQYDLRRIQNTQLTLAYTLQFAEGTGSDANTFQGKSDQGIIRTLFPLSFDERHNIQAIIDYRFDKGKRYNGPRVGGHDILAEFGANLTVSGVSGRPYTAKERATRFDGTGNAGALNGARLPWRIGVDLRLDKNFSLSKNESKPLGLNVYFRVSNLLNLKNVKNVYGATGSPKDDGFRDTPDGRSEVQSILNSGKDINAYYDAYSWRVLNQDYYGQPRRVYLGAIFDF